MSIIQTISDFLESIFRHSSPEVQKKIQMKKLDAELKSYYPNIYKDGFLLPNFGEAIFSLYKYTHVLDELFLSTVSSLDVQRQHRFEAQLILTGYSVSEQEIIASLSYERRKETIAAETRRVSWLAPERVSTPNEITEKESIVINAIIGNKDNQIEGNGILLSGVKMFMFYFAISFKLG